MRQFAVVMVWFTGAQVLLNFADLAFLKYPRNEEITQVTSAVRLAIRLFFFVWGFMVIYR